MKELIEKALKKALDTLVRADFELLQWNVHEQSVCHRLAIYLEPYFPGWNIDCEYNINHDISKALERLTKKLNIIPSRINPKIVRPDIIVHRRNEGKNLLVIEVKTTSNSESVEYDRCKLEAFKSQLHYQFAAFIKIKTGTHYCVEPIEWK